MTSINIMAPRCEYKTNPLGIDVANPRLCWHLKSDRRGARQTAYQILVAGSESALAGDQGDLWDTGKVLSDQSIHIVYAGKPLASRRRAYWKVRVWDENDVALEDSETAFWEMGLLERADWKGEWIGASLVGGPRSTIPAPFVRREFAVDEPIASARLYATALGLYECHINGKRVGEDVFTPGWTVYSKRVQYQSYDVTDLVKSGENAIGAILGDGWYCGHVEARSRQHYGDRPRLLAQLVIEFADGSAPLTIATDDSWKTAFGPIVESDLIMGEAYDARREFPGWSESGFDEALWRSVELFADPGVPLVAQQGPTVKAMGWEIPPVAEPKEVPRWPLHEWIFDMGQNMVGRVRLKVDAPAGTTIRLRFAEVLKPDGSIYTENLRSAKQTDFYTCKGGGEEIWESKFTFHGFRYVELVGLPGKVTRAAITGIVLHSNTPKTGTFECSDKLIDQLQRNIVWGQKGNFVDVPTDCPQRDERLGWTGDAQVFVRTAAFNMDVAGFFTKWARDLTDSQASAGGYPMVAPSLDADVDGGPAWADAGIICPWTMYLCYGDKRLLAEHYDGMVRFVDYLKTSSIDLIRSHPDYKGFHGFGDWLSINAETPIDLIGTAFFAYSARLLSEIARVLEKNADAEKYAALSEEVRQAFVTRYVTAGGLVAAQTQTAYVLALHFDLLPPEQRSIVADALVKNIEARGMHLSTGFVGSPYLPHVLSANGKLDTAFKLLNQKSWPSWLYPVTQGATTIWERWDGWTHDKGFQDAGMNSFNHYAYGAIGAWLYAVVAGIEIDPTRPAYKHIIFNPHPGGGLTDVTAALESIHGHIYSAWRITGDSFFWMITVPANTSATVYVPGEDATFVEKGGKRSEGNEHVKFLRVEEGRRIYEVASGTYSFASTIPAAGGTM